MTSSSPTPKRKRGLTLSGIGKSPARFDFKKLANICGQHIAQADDAALLRELEGYLAASQADLFDVMHKKSLLLSALIASRNARKPFRNFIDKAYLFSSLAR